MDHTAFKKVIDGIYIEVEDSSVNVRNIFVLANGLVLEYVVYMFSAEQLPHFNPPILYLVSQMLSF